MNKETFLKNAKALEINIDGNKVILEARAFSTGSCGWNANGKVTVMVDGKPVKCQLSLNLTAVGSKDWSDK